MSKITARNPSQEELGSLLEHYQNARYEDAEKLALSITQEFPDHPYSWTILGVLLEETGRASEALNANQRAVQLEPQAADGHYNLANTFRTLGRLEEAEASYLQALALAPEDAGIYYNLGVTLQGLERLEESRINYKQATTLKSDYAEAHYGLGLLSYGLGKFEEAATSYRQLIALQPNYAEAHYNLGTVLQELSRLDEAEASYMQAIALRPDYAGGHNNLGNILQERGRLGEAEASYAQAIVLEPHCVDAHYNLGNMLEKLGRVDEAEASLRQAIALKPDYAIIHSNLAKVLYRLGYKDSALESIENANDIDSEEKEYELILSVIKARKSREESVVAISDTDALTGLASSPIILNRVVEPELITNLYGINSRELDKTTDARYGNGKCSPDFNLFQDSRSIIQKLAEDLTRIMMEAVKSDVYIYDSFFNILGAGGGTTPHKHISELDNDSVFNLGKQKYSLVYYLSVGDQDCSEPGVLKLYEPSEDILPSEGMIMIIPARRVHSAVYGGKTDRVMIGVNFYSV